MAPGIEIPRGDPFSDPHSFSLQFYLAEGVSDAIDQNLAGEANFAEWDRTLTIVSRSPDTGQNKIEAGGIGDTNRRVQFAGQMIAQLRQSQSVHFLSLDADRSYPKKNFNVNEVAAAYEIDWAGVEYTRGRSFKTTTSYTMSGSNIFLHREISLARGSCKKRVARKTRRGTADLRRSF